MIVHGAVLVSAFLIFWFLAIFCLLPMGLGAEIDPESGAPLHPRLGKKLLLATAAASALWLGFYALVVLRILEL